MRAVRGIKAGGVQKVTICERALAAYVSRGFEPLWGRADVRATPTPMRGWGSRPHTRSIPGACHLVWGILSIFQYYFNGPFEAFRPIKTGVGDNFFNIIYIYIFFCVFVMCVCVCVCVYKRPLEI